MKLPVGHNNNTQTDLPGKESQQAKSGDQAKTNSQTQGEHQTKDNSLFNQLIHIIKVEAPFFITVLGIMAIFRIFIFDMNYIPSESMQPALEVGDRIVVNKFAYGISRHTIPFSLAPSFPGKNNRLFGSVPKRGDVITFKHPKTNVIFIKRVIGLPGDTVQYQGGRLYIDNQAIPRQKIENFTYQAYKAGPVTVDFYTESLDNGKKVDIFERYDEGRGDDTAAFTVPEGHLFVMGDNRDNSIDSRFLGDGVGFLPIEKVLGRADRILFSTYKCKKIEGLRCAKRGFFKAIR